MVNPRSQIVRDWTRVDRTVEFQVCLIARYTLQDDARKAEDRSAEKRGIRKERVLSLKPEPLASKSSVPSARSNLQINTNLVIIIPRNIRRRNLLQIQASDS